MLSNYHFRFIELILGQFFTFFFSSLSYKQRKHKPRFEDLALVSLLSCHVHTPVSNLYIVCVLRQLECDFFVGCTANHVRLSVFHFSKKRMWQHLKSSSIWTYCIYLLYQQKTCVHSINRLNKILIIFWKIIKVQFSKCTLQCSIRLLNAKYTSIAETVFSKSQT